VSTHDELRALLQRYARAVDDRDLDALAGVFLPTAVIEGVRGSQTLDEWLAGMAKPRTFPVSMHVLGEPLVAVDEDAGTATLDTYAVVYQLGDAGTGQGDLTLGIRYADEAVRQDGRWVLAHRRARTIWSR
jgi:hypothetical protein